MKRISLAVCIALLVSGTAQARSELWLPTGDTGGWGPAVPLSPPNSDVMAQIRCQPIPGSPTPEWTLYLQPADLAGTPVTFHHRDESGFSKAEMQSPSGQWIATAKLPRLKWGPWLADLRGQPPGLPDCSAPEVRIRLHQDQDRPTRRRVIHEAVRCRAGDPVRQAACAH